MMVQARRRTEELAAKRREREETLQSLATEYQASKMMADAAVEEAKRQAADLVTRAKHEADQTAEDMKNTVRKMLATGETRQGVAELLDVSVFYVRGIDVATSAKAQENGVDAAGEAGVEAPSATSDDDDSINRPSLAVASDPEAA